MNVEQMTVICIIIFSALAVATALRIARSFKRGNPRFSGLYTHRLIGGAESARAVARSLVDQVKTQHLAEVERSREQGHPTPELEKELDKAESYFLSRVEDSHSPLFAQIVDEIIFGREPGAKS